MTFSEINNFIQWTKKWHICHIFINIYTCIFYLALYCSISRDLHIFINALAENLTISLFFLFCMLYYALIIILIISVIEHIKKKKLRIQNKVLLYNKIYHIYYTHSFFIIIAFCTFACFFDICQLLIILYLIALILFIILKWIIISIIDLILKMINK